MGLRERSPLVFPGPREATGGERLAQPLDTLQFAQHALSQVLGRPGVRCPFQLLPRQCQLLERVAEMQELGVSLTHRFSPSRPVSLLVTVQIICTQRAKPAGMVAISAEVLF